MTIDPVVPTSAKEVAKFIDHSILQPIFTDQDLIKQCEIARQYEVAAVCVKPFHTALAKKCLEGSNVLICAVIGFPHGNSTTALKVAETLQVIKDGATEVDMVVNHGKVLGGDWDFVEQELKEINDACVQNGAILKVIFETDFITSDEMKIKLCEICTKLDIAFVKTSTGYGFVKQANGDYNYKGATDHELLLMKEHCGPQVKIKAAGGVRTFEQIMHVIKLGTHRVGASATEEIMKKAVEYFGS